MMEVGIAVLIVLIVIIVLAVLVVRRRRGEQSQQILTSLNGQTISATVTNIEEKTILVNPVITEFARRYFIQAEWTNAETQRTYFFTSAPLPEIPEHIRVGGSVKIRLDPLDPYEYIVLLAP